MIRKNYHHATLWFAILYILQLVFLPITDFYSGNSTKMAVIISHQSHFVFNRNTSN